MIYISVTSLGNRFAAAVLVVVVGAAVVGLGLGLRVGKDAGEMR